MADITVNFIEDEPILVQFSIENDLAVASSVTIWNEVPAGLINGINATFTTAFNFQAGKLAVRLNGLQQKIVGDYQTIGTNTIQFNVSPLAGEVIEIDYLKQ